MTLGFSHVQTLTLVFSDTLIHAPYTQKQDALIKLAEYIEGNEHIEDASSGGLHIIEAIYPFFTEKYDLREPFKWAVATRDLFLADYRRIQALGFEGYAPDGQLVMYCLLYTSPSPRDA